jgi:S1-C subfamily serine protease
MVRALVFATLAIFVPLRAQQTPNVLHIKVVLIDAAGNATPVPRHALLISENPASAPPRRTVTALDGTADVRLRPGNYTVESDNPVNFNGKAYHWTQTIDVRTGRDTVLELTAANAEVEAATSTTEAADASPGSDPAFLLPKWRDSIVGIWSPVAHGSGFVIDGTGLVATNQRVIGAATSVEVQISPTVKVAGTVLYANASRDVAILWIDPKVIASVAALPLPCKDTEPAALTTGQELYTIGVPLRQTKGMASGAVTRIDSKGLEADFILGRASAGGPVFTAKGQLVGLTSMTDSEDNRRTDTRVVRVEEACAGLAAAEKKKDGAAPSAALLPVEPTRDFPIDALRSAAQSRTGAVSPYQLSTSTFDVAFITPILTYTAQYQSQQPRPRTTSKDTRQPEPEPQLVRPLLDFSNWSEYVIDAPPVLLVRVTPRLVEGFWTMVARGAARTQGVAIPPIKRIRSGFSHLRAYCGEREVTPIHPFKLVQRISDDDAMFEGLYAFDPGALRPDCGAIKVLVFSEKEPEKAETLVVAPDIVKQFWQDFAPYRTASR